MASRFWVGGTGTWDASDTTHWASSSNGAGGQSVPGSSDTVTFDGFSGGGTVTVGAGYNPNCVSLTAGAFTGTLTFAVNNNSPTFQTVSLTGSGTRTISLGNGTWTITGTGSVWNNATVTNETLNANSSTIAITDTTTAQKIFNGGAKSYNVVSFTAATLGSRLTITAGVTIATLNVSPPAILEFSLGTTTITNAFNWAGTSANNIAVMSSSNGTVVTVSVASGAPTMAWAGVRDITFSGGATFTATNSLDLGGNTGITVTPPSTAGGISRARAQAGFH